MTPGRGEAQRRDDKALKDPGMRAAIEKEGGEVIGGTTKQLADLMKAELAAWATVVKASGAVFTKLCRSAIMPGFRKPNKWSAEYQHPNWQKRRLELLSATKWTCEICHDGDERLDVHHVHYRSKRKPWEYADHELWVLCKVCHMKVHEWKKLIRELLAEVPPEQIGAATAIVASVINELTPQNLEVAAVQARIGAEFRLDVQIGKAIANVYRAHQEAVRDGVEQRFLEDLEELFKNYILLEP